MAAHKYGMRSLHLKKNTAGTSNEISFSVLDAKKMHQETGTSPKKGNPLGKIALFSLPGTKKVKGAPTQEEGLPLASGEFASAAAEHDPTGTVTLGSNAISGGTSSSGFTEGFEGSVAQGSSGSLAKTEKRAKGSASFSADANDTPEKRRHKAKVFRRIGAVGLACGIIAAAAFGVYSLAHGAYENYLINQSYQQVLTSSLAEVVEADEILSDMDASFSDMLGDASLSAMKEVQKQLPFASQHLDNAEALVKRVQSSLSDEQDIQAAQNTLEAIETRRSMITLGESMISEALSVASQGERLTAAWNELLDADKQVRQIVSAFSALDADSVEKTKQEAEQAKDVFTQIKNSFLNIKKESANNADLVVSSYSAYIELRIEALEHLIASCEALQAEDIDLATTESNEYNSCDSRAVAQANTFPADITSVATDSFFEQVDTFEQQYDELLVKAASLDTALREYLRVTSS